MITEQEAQQLVLKLNDLKERSRHDSSLKKELQQHEGLCINKLGYLITMKMGRYKKFSNYEDLMQEGYEALLKGIKTYDSSKGSVFWWLHKYINTRISRSANLHTTIRYPLKVAKQQTPHKESAMPNIIDNFGCPEKAMQMMEFDRMLTEGSKNLSDQQKNIINMVFGLETSKPYSINKVSRETNLSRNAVLKELNNAINILRQQFKSN